MIQRMFRFLNHRYFTIFALVAMTYILGAQSDAYFKWTKPSKNQLHAINSDGCGYYAYLPQVFVHKTKHFEFHDEIQKRYPTSKFFQGLSPGKGKEMHDKYFVGTAVCMAPLFLVADQITRWTGGVADGYSILYEVSVLLSAIAFWLLGAISLLVLLKRMGISNFPVLIVIAGITFATNLNFYIVYDIAFSHAFTFGLVAFFVLQCHYYVENSNVKHLIWIGFLIGLIVLIRPTNGIVLLIFPFLFSSFQDFWSRLKFIFAQQKIGLFIALSCFAGLLFLQCWNIHSQYGYWGFNAYSAEGFDFLLDPQIREVMVGFRKGFLVYTPYMILLIPSFIVLYKSNRYLFWGILLVTTLFIYIMASWWCWYYGGSLGMRPLIDVYAIFAIPLILFVVQLRKFGTTLLLIFSGIMIYFNLTLNYQMLHSILHFSEMNKERFFQVFLQTDDRFKFIFFTNNPVLERDRFESMKSFTIQNGTWKNQNKPIQNAGNSFPSLIFIPDSTFAGHEIAVDLNYQFRLTNEEAIPKTVLFGYVHGVREEISIHFMGPQIPKLDRFYSIHAPLTSTKKYQGFDSLEVIIEHGATIGIAKQVFCEFGKWKSK